MKLPLEDVEAWPPSYVGALRRGESRTTLMQRRTRIIMHEMMITDPHLHTLALLAGEWGFHHAVILTQSPGLVDKLDIVDSG